MTVLVRQHMIELFFKSPDTMPRAASCEKDMYIPSHGDFADQHLRIARPQGLFHVLCFGGEITLEVANHWVDQWITGHVKVIDLRQFNVRP